MKTTIKTMPLLALILVLLACKKKDVNPSNQNSTSECRATYHYKYFIIDSMDYGKIRIQVKNTSYFIAAENSDTATARYGYQVHSLVSIANPPKSFKLKVNTTYLINADINIWMGDWQNTPIEFRVSSNGDIINVVGNSYLLNLIPVAGTNKGCYQLKYKRY